MQDIAQVNIGNQLLHNRSHLHRFIVESYHCMLHAGTYCTLIYNISEMTEKNEVDLILFSSRKLTGIRNLICLAYWEE